MKKLLAWIGAVAGALALGAAFAQPAAAGTRVTSTPDQPPVSAANRDWL